MKPYFCVPAAALAKAGVLIRSCEEGWNNRNRNCYFRPTSNKYWTDFFKL